MMAFTTHLDPHHTPIFAHGALQAPPCAHSSHPPHVQVVPFSHGLLATASLVVSLFGQTCYEAIYYRTPVLMFGHTEENVRGATHLMEAVRGTAICGGHIRTITGEDFCHALTNMLTLQEYMGASARKFSFDGHGVTRVANAILALGGKA